MNDNFKKRKADFARYFDEELTNEPRGWWQQRINEYSFTKDMGSGTHKYPPPATETIIQYDFKRALISGALFLSGNFILWSFIAWQKGGPFPFPVGMILIVFVVMFCPLLKTSNKGTVIHFDKQGFRVNTMPEPVPWDYLVASYIRKDNSGDSASHYLLLIYYDETTDEFVKTDYCIDGLKMTKEQIASHLEYWKIIAGTSAIVFQIAPELFPY